VNLPHTIVQVQGNTTNYKEYCKDLTEYQDIFHKKMSSFAKKQQCLKKEKPIANLHKEWMDFSLKYFDVIPLQKFLYSSCHSDTSDETKQLELRSNK
jgi:hypothetical protein